jgi:hypothetical protein
MLCAFRRPIVAALFAGLAITSFTGIIQPSIAEAKDPDFVQAAPAVDSAALAQASAADIVRAKTNVADMYSGYLAGTITAADLDKAERMLEIMTGETIKDATAENKAALAANYSPFRQVTDYYCGPATVQSILWALGVRDEAGIANPAAAKGMTGRGDVDQRLLASGTHLRTENGGGTDWGAIVPDTINNWRGTRWYQAFGTAKAGGALHKDQAWRDIVYAIDHGYPVAANVALSSNTVLPTGFNPGMTYYHWETIAGYFEKDGVKYVKVGQVYGASNLEYDPLQEIPWDTYWPAVGTHFGIVW